MKRTLALFFYETSGDTRDWDYLDSESFDTEKLSGMTWNQFEDWFAAKLPITRDEVLSGTWKKVGANGQSFTMRFFADGTYEERNVHTGKLVARGTWGISGDSKVLQTTITAHNSTYALDVVKEGGDNFVGVSTANEKLLTHVQVYHFREEGARNGV